jgi:hypothetical protein
VDPAPRSSRISIHQAQSVHINPPSEEAMQIKPEDLLPIQDILKESGISLKEGQVEKIVDTVNRLLQFNDDLEKQSEAEMGPEAWAKVKAEREASIARIGKDLTARLENILGNMEPTDKL